MEKAGLALHSEIDLLGVLGVLAANLGFQRAV
jgi:hypothetical protein